MAKDAAPKETGTKLSGTEKERKERLEKRIEDALQAYQDAGEALLAIRQDRLYRDSYSTWEEYLRERWDLSDSRARQLMRAASVHRILVGSGTSVPVNEAQARELAPLLKDEKTLVAVAQRVLLPERQATAAEIRAEVRKARLSGEVPDTDSLGLDFFRHETSVAAKKIGAAVDDIINSVRATHQLHPDDFDRFIKEVTKRLRETGFPEIGDDEWWRPLVEDVTDTLRVRTREARTDAGSRPRRKTGSAA